MKKNEFHKKLINRLKMFIGQDWYLTRQLSLMQKGKKLTYKQHSLLMRLQKKYMRRLIEPTGIEHGPWCVFNFSNNIEGTGD